MRECSREILQEYQIRKTRRQKDAFIDYLSQRVKELGFEMIVEEGGYFKSRNLVAGDVDKAKVILGAHYDTCAQLPFPNFLTPKNIPVYLLFNLILLAVIFLLEFVLSFILYSLTHDALIVSLGSLILCIALIYMMLAGKPNKHTVNDNTSGVITLLEIMGELDEKMREQVAFVFFDHEEIGLFGSMAFVKKHKKALEDKLLINFDCVSDGDHLMFILNKKAQAYASFFQEAFKCENKEIIVTKASNTLYPSDQLNFKCSAGVAAFHKNKYIGYYISRIHTPKDLVMDEKNIEILKNGAMKLMTKLSDMVQ